MAKNGIWKKRASLAMARLQLTKIWANPTMARSRPQKHGLAQLANGL